MVYCGRAFVDRPVSVFHPIRVEAGLFLPLKGRNATPLIINAAAGLLKARLSMGMVCPPTEPFDTSVNVLNVALSAKIYSAGAAP